MTILPTATLANWGDFLSPGVVLAGQPSVTPSGAWGQCIEALKSIASSATALEFPPNSATIQLALDWLKSLEKQFPSSPPTLIAAEPAGGIIVERRVQLADGTDLLTEMTFYNRGEIEVTHYRNGRVESMQTMPS